MFFDPLYMMLALPGLILGLIASGLVKSTFAKYSKKYCASGLTGAQAADRMLKSQGIYDVTIEPVRGFLSDHYDPRTNTLRLSPEVYQNSSLSAVGVACHEAGHALQKASHYGALELRTLLVPVAQIGTNFAYVLFFAGFFLRMQAVMQLGVILFAAAVVFTLVTLPVEWNASARAKKLMVSSGVVTPAEQEGAAAVLNAAFLTYVAAAVTAVLTLLYYAIRAGLLGGRDD
ncbi:MAG: zinc metallopeptidase [Spartobacteria bacterium]|nr:zinc metallopeptidase [Spartobacteria bacterium]